MSVFTRKAFGLYKLTDSSGETYNLKSTDDLSAIKEGIRLLGSDNGCVKTFNGRDVAALTVISGVRMVQLA